MTSPTLADAQTWVRAEFERHEPALLRYARRLVGDAESARDVVQETFLRLCRQDRVQLDGHITEWLYTVCRNRALEIRRKERRMTTVAEFTPQPAEIPAAAPDCQIERQDTTRRVLELLVELPDNQQEVLRLKFQGGLSYREIASVAGLTVGHVGYLIHTGLQTLRRKLDP